MAPTPPVIVFVPGFLRSERVHATLLAGWRREFTVMVWHLPGHLRPRSLELGLRPMLAQFRQTTGTVLAHSPILIVGESLGGLLGMLLAVNSPPTNVRAVLAVDPPLNVGKLWPIHEQLSDAWKLNPASELLQDYADPIFGHPQSGVVSPRDYRSVLRHPPGCPVHVLAGDAPLWPERERPSPPSLLDEDDRKLIKDARGFQLHVTQGDIGHEVCLEAPDQVTDVLRAIAKELSTFH